MLYRFILRKLVFFSFLSVGKTASLQRTNVLSHTVIYPSIRSHLSVTGVTLILCDASNQTIIRYICKLGDVCRLAVFFYLVFIVIDL